jgi:hypothetical protein
MGAAGSLGVKEETWRAAAYVQIPDWRLVMGSTRRNAGSDRDRSIARSGSSSAGGAQAIHSGYCPNVEASFMGPSDSAEAVEVLDLLLKFLGDGERWVKGRWSDRRGNRCLVGALDFVSSHHAINGKGAECYLADEVSAAAECNGYAGGCARFRAGLRRAMSGDGYRASETVLRRDGLSDFNDGCRDFAELRGLILQARARAVRDVDRAPSLRPHLDIALDECIATWQA